MQKRITKQKNKRELIDVSSSSLPQLISPDALAERLEMTAKAVRELGLPQIRIGHRSIRYRVSDVEKFLAERELKGFV